MSVLGISTTAVGAEDPNRLMSPFMINLLAAGLCVLTAWCVWRVIRPAKLLLASTPGRRNKLTPIHILLPFLGCLAASGGLFLALAETMGPESPRLQALSMLAAQLSMLILGTITAAYTFPLGLRRGLGLTTRHWLNDTFRGVLGYIALVPICLGLEMLSKWILPESMQHQHQALVILGLRDLPIIWKAMAVFGAVILAPLAEEIFFRGLLQSMVRRYSGPWPAVVISSVVFAAMHHHTPQGIAPLLALGIVLGYNYEHTGRLYRSILIHALFNVVAVTDRLMAL